MASVVSLFALYTLVTTTSAENIALHKPTNQIGAYSGATANEAVDGRYDVDTGDDYYLSVCAIPDISGPDNGPAMWWVDLEDTYSISTVTVWNTYNLGFYWTMNNFTVEVVTSDNTRQSCGDYIKREPVSRGGSYTFNCNNKQGKYVFVRKLQRYRDQGIITLCEVIVEGFLVTTTKRTTTIMTTTTTATTATTTATTTPTTATTTTTTTTTTAATQTATRSSSGENTGRYDTTKRCTCTTSWVLFGVACVGNITFATLYINARKQHAHANKTTSHTEVSTLEQNMGSYSGNSSRHQDDITRDQQTINTSNIDNAAYEDVDVNNIHLTSNENGNVQTTQQYQSLHGQMSDYVNETHYERIREG